MGAVKVNRKLNLVLDVETEKGTAHVHSVPVSRATFEDNFLAIARTFTAFYTNGLGPLVGPRVARLMLLREADALGEKEKVLATLIPEIERLTNVLIPGERKWESMPFQAARNRKVIDDDSADEILNCLVYFTCASAIHMRQELMVTLEALRQFWGAVTTSLNATEYMNSLPTLIKEETTGEKPTLPLAAVASSIPT